MAKLIFNGFTHQISLVGKDGTVSGTWAAYNNVDRHATLTHVQNGSYTVTDTRARRRHQPNADGPYGLHGVIRFAVPGHPGIGVHSGRANARNLPGPAHPTMGCIRTSDEAMMAIAASMNDSPLTAVEVVDNSAPMARSATHRNQHRRLRGRHRA
ncbi:MAG: L,D-transpeptidase family protein [Massilia sp.]